MSCLSHYYGLWTALYGWDKQHRAHIGLYIAQWLKDNALDTIHRVDVLLPYL